MGVCAGQSFFPLSPIREVQRTEVSEATGVISEEVDFKGVVNQFVQNRVQSKAYQRSSN
jgi:hypothetical protein